MITRRELLAATLTALLALPTGVPQARAGATLRIGVLPVLNPRASMEVFLPLQDYLGRGPFMRPELYTTPDFHVLYERIHAGQFDLALAPPHLARLAQVDLGWHLLARCGPDQRALLLSLEDTGPANPEALRGGTIAVLDRGALVVHVVLEALGQRGLREGRDFSLLETRNYESSRLSVMQGRAHAFVSRSRGFFETRMREPFKTLLDAGAVPGYVFIASPRLPPVTRYQLAQDLISFAGTPAGQTMLAKLGYQTLGPNREDSLSQLDPYLDSFRASFATRH